MSSQARIALLLRKSRHIRYVCVLPGLHLLVGVYQASLYVNHPTGAIPMRPTALYCMAVKGNDFDSSWHFCGIHNAEQPASPSLL